MNAPQLSIVIAAFSEVDSLSQTVAQLQEGFSGIAYEIIIVAHPASTQECIDNARRMEQASPDVRFAIQQQLPGQGFAYRQGIGLSRGEYILLMNADLETHPPHARALYDTILAKGCDLVVASRWCSGAHFDRKSYGSLKLALNYLFQRLFGFAFGTRVTDLSFCYKIGGAWMRELSWTGTQHEFALETTLVPIALGMKVEQVPTIWQGRREGVSHFSFWRNMRHVRLALRVLFATRIGRLAGQYR